MSKINVHKATIRKFNSSRRRTVQEERACCGEPWLVLADPSDSTSWKNDRSLVFEKCDDLTVTVQKKGADLALPAQGVSISFPNDPETLGFIIDWRLYYDGSNELIQGQYDVFVETVIGGVTERFLWNTFMLFKYNEQNADGTVRIFSYFNHYSELYDIDFSGSGALDTVRFRGFFGYRQPNYETKNNTEISKKREKVFNKTNNVYGLIVEPTVECKTQRIEELHLLHGSVIYISDHNDHNHNIANDVYKDKPVILSNDESPEFDYFEGVGTKYAKVLAKFKDKISKRKSRNTGTGENVIIPDVGLWNGVVCPAGGDCEDASYQLTLDGNPLEGGSGSIPSGDNANIPIDAFIPDCEDVTLNFRDTTGIFETLQVASGGERVLRIIDQFGALVDFESVDFVSPQSINQTINIPTLCDRVSAADWVTIKGCMDSEQIEAAEADLCDCPPAPTPKGQMPLKTWQTTPQGSGTDGDLEQGYGVSLLVLPYNNPFGNTNRFTAPDGSQTYTDAIACDWLSWNESTNTVLMVHFGSGAGEVLTTNRSLADGITYINGLTVGGYSGWNMINKSQLEFITENETSLNNLNYPPFNIGNVLIQTNTAYSATQRACRVAAGSISLTTSSARTLAVRIGTVSGTVIS